MTQEELTKLQSKALEQFKSGKSLFGKDGAFAPMLKQFLEAALESEMDEHLSEIERKGGNKRNGKGKKTIKSSTGGYNGLKYASDFGVSMPVITVQNMPVSVLS